MQINPARGFSGQLQLPGDKSISHRLVLASLLIDGSLEIGNPADGEDVQTSLQIVKQLGVEIKKSQDRLLLSSSGSRPGGTHELYCGNSGTTTRLLAAILAGRPGRYRLTGDASLSRRPMRRIVEPLRLMGADIVCENSDNLPIVINGQQELLPLIFENPLGSAQVKSAVLLAGMHARGETRVHEALPSRDHTERLLAQLGVEISFSPGLAVLQGPGFPTGQHHFEVPGDISSAAFFAVAAAIFHSSTVVIENVSLNPGRLGFLEVLRRMGAAVTIAPAYSSWEPTGTISISGRGLRAVKIDSGEIPGLIDELPALSVAMAFAVGRSTVSGASELRNKESDRISRLIEGLRKAGVTCSEAADGFSIEGSPFITGGSELDPAGDHRLAMAFAVLGCRSEKGIFLHASDCVKISFHDFFNCLNRCIRR